MLSNRCECVWSHDTNVIGNKPIIETRENMCDQRTVFSVDVVHFSVDAYCKRQRSEKLTVVCVIHGTETVRSTFKSHCLHAISTLIWHLPNKV